MKNSVRGWNKPAREFDVFTGVQIAIEAWEVAATDFNAKLVAGREVVAALHRLQRDLVNFSFFHPYGWLVIAIAIAHALDVVDEVVSRTIRKHIDELDREVRILSIA